MALDYQITAETSDQDGIAKQILEQILRYNAQQAGPLDDSRVVLTVRNKQGTLLGGLVGIRFWNGLFIDLVWVTESHRKRGIGKELMNRAESEVKAHGGEVVFLSTWSFQAPGFYEKLGYKAFGTLENMPRGFSRTWYRKWL
jgi:GNAT superfamily N-acetyltransferase